MPIGPARRDGWWLHRLDNVDREHAFTAANVRLLTTLVGTDEHRAGECGCSRRRRAAAPDRAARERVPPSTRSVRTVGSKTTCRR